MIRYLIAGWMVWLVGTSADGAQKLDPIWQATVNHPDKGLNNLSVAAVLQPLSEAAPAGDWTTAYTVRNGDIWLGGGAQTARWHRAHWTVFTSTNQMGPALPVRIATMFGTSRSMSLVV